MTGVNHVDASDSDVAWREMAHTQRAYALWVRGVYVGYIAERVSSKTWHGALALTALPGDPVSFDAQDEAAAKHELITLFARWLRRFRGIELHKHFRPDIIEAKTAEAAYREHSEESA